MKELPTHMSAAVYRGKDNVLVETIAVPEIGPDEALVRIDVCGVCGTDLKKIHYGLVDPPRIFGHEMAGEIMRLGESVDGWRVGERVAVMHHVPCRICRMCRLGFYAQCPVYKETATTAGFTPSGGGFARYIRVNARSVRDGMVRVPDHVSLEWATFIEPLNTVLKAVKMLGDPSSGSSVLVVGQGQIGLLFTQLLVRVGWKVTSSDPLAWRREKSLAFGASTTIDPSSESLSAAVLNATDRNGVDAAIVAVPDNGVVAEAMDAVRPGGTVLLFAHTRLGDALSVDPGQVCMLEKRLIGSYSSDIDLQDEAAQLIFEREVDIASLITHRLPLTEIAQAIAVASHPRDRSLKVMIDHTRQV